MIDAYPVLCRNTGSGVLDFVINLDKTNMSFKLIKRTLGQNDEKKTYRFGRIMNGFIGG